ncbi:MAG: PAS domain S-box protein [Methylococcaceae bacterium]|nr:PAS domain S-box protein [Methylococcaceae bacterium]
MGSKTLSPQQPSSRIDTLEQELRRLERQNAELQRSHARLQCIVDTASNGIVTADQDGIILTVNRAAARMFGYAEAELLGRSVNVLMFDADRLHHDGWIKAYLATGHSSVMGSSRDLVGRRKDGSGFPLNLALGEFVAEGQRYFTAVLQDVGDRKRAEEAARTRAEQLAAIFRQTTVGFVQADIAGRIFWVNDRFCQLLGRSRATLEGCLLANLVDELDWPEAEGMFVHCVETGADFVAEQRFVLPDGGRLWARSHASRLCDAGGRATGILAAIVDITDRKHAELEMHERLELEGRLARIADAVPGVICSYRLRSDGTILMPFASPAVREVLGLEPADVGQDAGCFFGRIHPDDVVEVRASMAEAAAGPNPWRDAFRYRHPNEGERWLEGHFLPQRQDDGSLLWHGFLMDVTDRKATERQARENQRQYERLLKLEVASQTIAAIAHELNQPLSAAASYADAALRFLQAGNPKPAKLVHALEQGVQQIGRAGQVVHELFQFIRAGEILTEPLDVNGIVREVIGRLREDGHLGGFATLMELADDLRPVSANRLHVEKVLINLIRNGVEAMRDAGLSSGAIVVTVQTSCSGDCAQVTVRDSGPGLEPEASRRIFKPFFTTKPEGLGMGLVLSRALIEAHGGELWAELTEEPGATFHLTLPFAQDP